MKRAGLIFLFLAFLVSGYSQTDTLFTKTKKKISCRITEIGESDIKYKMPDNLDGPVYVISTTKVYKYSLANGTMIVLTPDELLVENQHQEILNRRSVIKVHPFSYVNNQIGVAYEHVMKMGTNLDLELGYINDGMMPNTASWMFQTSSGGRAPMSGFYFKPGVKFMLGQDFSLKGMKYAHPLKGRFIMINAVASFLNYQDAYFIESQSVSSSTTAINPPYSYSYTYTITTNGKSQNVNCFAYGLMVNYGRQFILGNCVTLEYYIGLGATGQSIGTSNAVSTSTSYVTSSNYPMYYYNYNYNSNDNTRNVSNYHGFFRAPGVGLSFAFGFRMGFILPEKKAMPAPNGSPGANRQ